LVFSVQNKVIWSVVPGLSILSSLVFNVQNKVTYLFTLIAIDFSCDNILILDVVLRIAILLNPAQEFCLCLQ
jgi:hypothetical protein